MPIQRFKLPSVFALCLILGAADGWQDVFNVPAGNFVSTGKSTYFILEPGHQMKFEGKDGDRVGRLVITVLDDTKMIDGIETRVVEERETLDDKLVEVSRNYFAIEKATGDVYYFGEDVDDYKDGKIAGHGGSWLSGRDGARFGLFIPAAPKVGQKYYQEIAPKVAMDRAEVVRVTETVRVPAGNFEKCLKTEETTPLEAAAKENKLYAPNVGLVTDGDLKLVKHGPRQK